MIGGDATFRDFARVGSGRGQAPAPPPIGRHSGCPASRARRGALKQEAAVGRQIPDLPGTPSGVMCVGTTGGWRFCQPDAVGPPRPFNR
jgi:hypothetical protein